MKKTIDCLFIGHNEMDFTEYEKNIRKMSVNSGAYRDLHMNFIRYNNKPYSISEAFNYFYCSDRRSTELIKPLNLGESFSAAAAYLGTYLARRGFTFDYVNSFQDRKAQLAEKLTQNQILAIAIITTLYVFPLPILEIIDFIKMYNQTAKIIIGGPFISTQVRTKDPDSLEYLLASTLKADFYINSSQGEATLVQLLHALKNNLPCHNINNIYYKNSSQYTATPVVNENNQLSENMVNWDLFHEGVDEYVNTRTAISCPYACSFCGFPQHQGKYQPADIDAIEMELKLLDKIKTVKSVHFIDDTFNVPKERFKDLLRMMIKNKFRFRWHSYFRCQFADQETMELMKESGCDGVFLGIESGSNQILKHMNKIVRTDEYLRGIELLHKYGIVTFGSFIIGFAGETPETVRETVNFIEKSGLDFFRTQLWYCEPLTPIWNQREQYGIKGESFEWQHNTMDSQQACDLIEDIFLTARDSDTVWLPQYNFDFATLWHLVHRGMGINQVKQFVRSFNNGIREKLQNPSLKEVSYEIIKQLKNAGEDEDSDENEETHVNLSGLHRAINSETASPQPGNNSSPVHDLNKNPAVNEFHHPDNKIDENVLFFTSKFVKQKQYWLEKLTGELQPIGLLCDFDRNYPGNTHLPVTRNTFTLVLPQRLYHQLMKLSKQSDLSLYILLLAALKLLIYRYTHNSDIIVVSPINKLKITGDTINDLVLIRDRLEGDMSFKEWVLRVRQSVLDAYANQDYPFEKLWEYVFDQPLEKDNPFISQVVCSFSGIHDEDNIAGLTGKLSFSFVKEQGRLAASIGYELASYTERDIRQISGNYLHLLAQALEDIHWQCAGIPLLSMEEKKQLIYEFNNNHVDIDTGQTIPRLIAGHAVTSPHRAAVGFEDQLVTYKQLNRRSDQLAGLLKKRGVHSDQPVGILLDRSPLMVESILAVWKAGGAYIPIDPAYPLERIKFILDDARAPVLLTGSQTLKTHELTFIDLQTSSLNRQQIHETGRRGQITDFNRLPFPDRSLVNYEKYNRHIGQASVKYSMALQATRGCPYNCAYCHKIWPKSHVVRTAEHIFSEVSMFYNLGIRRFAIIDDIFNLNIANSSRFFQMIIDNGMQLRLFFPNGLRGDLLTKDYIDLMMEAGTVSLALALETASPRLQKLIGKNLNLDKLSENIQYICTQYPHVIFELFTMHGFPTETWEEALMTLDFIKRYKWIHFPYVEILKVFPDTEMEKLALKNGVSREAIRRSDYLAFHELPDTLPFDKTFTRKYQADFLSDYFLAKERLLHVLPHQMKLLTEDEMVQKYNSYLPVDIRSFADFLEFAGIPPADMDTRHFLEESSVYVPDLNEKLAACFQSKQAKQAGQGALKVLLLDLSQFFSGMTDMLYDVIEPPLGLMYLMSYLKQQLGNRIDGKIAKARNDFDNYSQLKELLDTFKPDVIGIRTLTFYKDFFHRTIAVIRQWGIHVPIIAGGPYATSSYKEILQDRNIDLVVLGEGELTLGDLITAIIEENNTLPHEDRLKNITGIAFVPGRKEGNATNQAYSARQVLLVDELYPGHDVPEPCEPFEPPEPHGNEPGTGTQVTDLAYIIFTSGTTGKPKGAMVEHIGMMNHMAAKINDLHISGQSTIAQNASHTFDISVWQFFAALIQAGKTIIYPNEVILEPQRFIRHLIKHRITILEVVPSYLSVMLDTLDMHPGTFVSLQYLLITGEEVKPGLATRWFETYPAVQVVNAYGPTEASDDITHYIMTEPPDMNDIPIGYPVQNLKIYMVDKHGNLCPPGVAGEIWVSGIGVGRGYLNKVEKTRQVFGKDPFDLTSTFPRHLPPENVGRIRRSRLYKTGDLGLRHPDGLIRFLGRKDSQVKIRGFRIELGEIENRLLQHPAVKEAVVIDIPDKTDENQTRSLCAYVVIDGVVDGMVDGVVDNGGTGISELSAYLQQHLPDYMVPGQWVELEKIPLTPTGKIDRKALPEIETVDKDKTGYIAPKNPVEELLAGVIAAVLGRDNVGTDKNFFEMGGDSIKAIQIASRMYKAGYKVEMRDIFQNPSIAELAPRAIKLDQTADQSMVTGTVPLTPIQVEFFQKITVDGHHFNQAVMLSAQEGFDDTATRAVFKKIQQHHDALRMSYQYNEHTGKITQTIQGPEYPLSLSIYDFRGCADRESVGEAFKNGVNAIQAGINLENGPLMKLGLFHLDDGDRLLIVIHHLAVDGVSWRILFEDLQALYRQYKNREPLELPLKTDSVKVWSEKLQEYAHDAEFLPEKAYWAQLEAEAAHIPPLENDFETGNNLVKDAVTASFQLSQHLTGLLLTGVNEAFGTDINDILLTALSLAVHQIYGLEQLVVALERHGREEIFNDVNISRTVGWFTSVFPVLLKFHPGHELSRQIIETKETLRRIPNNGIGYGILKYLTGKDLTAEIDFRITPRLSFNYLGQFDADLEQTTFKIAGESVGNSQSLHSPREYELEINGMISAGKLAISLTYNKNQYKKETIEGLLTGYRELLTAIIRYCSAREGSELTPGDLTYSRLSIDKLEQLKKQYPLQDIYTLSPMQEGMLFHALFANKTVTYFEQLSYRLQGPLDIGYVQKSLDELMKRYDILRTVFIYEGLEQPLQVVLKDRSMGFLYREIHEIIGSNASDEEKEAYIKTFKENDRQSSFNLSEDVSMRVSILKIDPGEYEFTWSFHHILMDGWCLGILISEFSEIYSSFLEQRPYELPPVKPYRTYIQWLEKQDRHASKTYWAHYLAGYEEPAVLPGNDAHRGTTGHTNQRISMILDPEKTGALNRLAATYQVTLNTLIQAIWAVVLSHYTSRRDMVFGAVVSGRPAEIEGVESMVGLFINTIPVRLRFEITEPFHCLLQRMQENAIKSEPHHHYPLYQIQSATPLKHHLLDHIFVFENYPIAQQIDGLANQKKEKQSAKQSQGPLKISKAAVFEQTNYDFNVQIIPGHSTVINLDFNENVYERKLVERIASSLQGVIHQVLADAQQPIDSIEVLSEAEKNQLLYEFNHIHKHNQTKTGHEQNQSLHLYQLFEEQADHTPDVPALIFAGHHLTYRELQQRAGQLALFLQHKGVQPDDIVGIIAERSIEMIIGIMGILKSAGAYLPIEPDSPQKRIQYILKDSAIKILLALPGTRFRAKDGVSDEQPLEIIDIHALSSSSDAAEITASPRRMNPTHLAYVIYTSGSTGRPKGVLVEHRGLVNAITWRKSEYKLSKEDRVLQLFSFAFDGSVTSFFTPLISGAPAVLISDEETKDIVSIKQVIITEKITHFICISSLYLGLLEILTPGENELNYLRLVTLAGEAVNPIIIEKSNALVPAAEIINEYGATENTVVATIYRNMKPGAVISIGKPIANMQIYILDHDHCLVPIGVSGELCIAGKGVARGYFNRPGLTAEKFYSLKRFLLRKPKIHNLYKIYKTGDLARWLPDGNLEHLGRIDTQVKIRGFRIELGEIETQLLKLPELKQALVIQREDRNGNPVLCAYIVYKQKQQPQIISSPSSSTSTSTSTLTSTLTVPAIKEYLAETLPAYMIPTHVIPIDKIPLTPTGKIDNKRLPPPGIKTSENIAAPETETEKIIAAIWKEVLGLEQVGVNDNFFDLGGNSFFSIKIVGRIKEALKRDVRIVAMYRYLTVRSFARYLDQGEGEANQEFLKETRAEKINEGKTRLKQTMKLMKKRAN